MVKIKSILDWEPPDVPATEVNASYAKDFDSPGEEPEGMIWWFRPCYFSASTAHFRWTCAFCSHTEDNRNNYGQKGYKCSKCEAVFVGDNWFGTWMAKLMDKKWAENKETPEIWG